MAQLSDLESSIRAAIDHDSDTAVTQAQIYAWVNERYYTLRRRLANLFPDLYTKVTADFTIAQGASSQDVTASPLSLTDFGKVRVLQWKTGLDYWSLPLANGINPERSGRLSWRLRGATVLDIFPALMAPGTYRLRYVTKAIKLAAPTDVVDLPDGAETVLIEDVARRCRVRVDEDPSFHSMFKSEAWQELLASLQPLYVSTPMQIQDVRGPYR